MTRYPVTMRRLGYIFLFGGVIILLNYLFRARVDFSDVLALYTAGLATAGGCSILWPGPMLPRR